MEEIKESRGGNQIDDKKGETYMRRSSTGKKEGRKAAYFGAYGTYASQIWSTPYSQPRS